jgi:hypothetical protein
MRKFVILTATAAALMTTPAALTGAPSFLTATSAYASSLYTRVLHAYQLAGGSIPPCEFTSAQLEAAMKSADTYENQYLADFSNAIDNALSQRASGACGGGTRSPAVALGKSRYEPLLKPGQVTAATGANVPAPIVLLAALGAALLVTAGIGGLARARGWEPTWASTWRHAWSEAEYRVGGGWASVADVVRARRHASAHGRRPPDRPPSSPRP